MCSVAPGSTCTLAKGGGGGEGGGDGDDGGGADGVGEGSAGGVGAGGDGAGTHCKPFKLIAMCVSWVANPISVGTVPLVYITLRDVPV